ncbi:hypothetical protein MASR2M74_36610 [Paracoccaceae bacterium]
MTPAPRVHTFYQSNIPPGVLAGQKAVFAHFEIPLVQEMDNSIEHGTWVTRLFAGAPDDIIVLADIDAFPLSRRAFDAMIERAEAGELVGLAQVANHKDPSRIYAGPMFLAIRRSLYHDLGAPALTRSPTADVAQALTDQAQEAGKTVTLIPPRFAIQPKWPLAGQGVFGIGTFYGEMEFFHLFQSRKRNSVALFEAVARDTLRGSFDYANYLQIMAPKKRFGLF